MSSSGETCFVDHCEHKDSGSYFSYSCFRRHYKNMHVRLILKTLNWCECLLSLYEPWEWLLASPGYSPPIAQSHPFVLGLLCSHSKQLLNLRWLPDCPNLKRGRKVANLMTDKCRLLCFSTHGTVSYYGNTC